MGIGIRSIGNFAGGMAGGLQRGQGMKIAGQTADMTKELYDKQGKYYDEMAEEMKRYPTLQSMVSRAKPQQAVGGVPAAMGGVEEADQVARTAAPPSAPQPSPLATQLAAPAAPTPMVTGGGMVAAGGTPTRFAVAGGARRLPFSPDQQLPVE